MKFSSSDSGWPGGVRGSGTGVGGRGTDGGRKDTFLEFSGRMLACHAGGPGSIPGRCTKMLHTYTRWSEMKNTKRGSIMNTIVYFRHKLWVYGSGCQANRSRKKCVSFNGNGRRQCEWSRHKKRKYNPEEDVARQFWKANLNKETNVQNTNVKEAKRRTGLQSLGAKFVRRGELCT
jgi:hypothetical protein